MDNPEKLANAGHTRQRKQQQKRKQKNTTMCVGNHYPQAITPNVNKTWALLQTTGGRVESSIVLYVEITTQNPKRKDT